MPRPDKVEAVKEIAADLAAVDTFYFVDYRGLNFSEATELRARLSKVDANIKVVKNTLAKIAASEAGIEGVSELFQGPTAIAYCHGDPIRVAKTLQEFIKETKKAAIRGGRLQHSLLSAAEVETLALLPSREQLVAQALGAISSPLTGLANVLSAPLRGLVVALGRVQEQKAMAA